MAHNHELTAASISGIGGIYGVTVAFYNFNEKRYIEQIFPETYELLPSIGNATMKDGEYSIPSRVKF